MDILHIFKATIFVDGFGKGISPLYLLPYLCSWYLKKNSRSRIFLLAVEYGEGGDGCWTVYRKIFVRSARLYVQSRFHGALYIVSLLCSEIIESGLTRTNMYFRKEFSTEIGKR